MRIYIHTIIIKELIEMGLFKKLFKKTEESKPLYSVLSESKMTYAAMSGDLPNDKELENLINETNTDELGFSGAEGVEEYDHS